MSERPIPQPNPEHLLQLKDNILEHWAQLPPEHQASMALVLYSQVLAGEYGPWLRSSIEVMEQKETHGPYKFLPILRISPEHLAQTTLTEEEIGRLDDEDLRYISHQIVRHYTNDVFWEELEFVARSTLADKPGE
jgi:hypothetical protein